MNVNKMRKTPQKRDIARAIAMLTAGGVGVIPTDTVYGIVGSALRPSTVARIYRLRERNKKKPMILLISSPKDLQFFRIKTAIHAKQILKKVWPGKVSVVFPCASKKFSYLHRGTKTIAFRMPKLAWLRALLKKTGPLVAPSANIEGEPPARTVREARKYFGNKIDFYIDGGKTISKPSTLIEIKKGRPFVLRMGAVTLR